MNIEFEFLGEDEFGRLGAVPVTGDADEIQLHRQVYFPDEVGHKHERAGEQTDDDEVAVFEIALNLFCQLSDATLNLLFGEKRLGDGIARVWHRRLDVTRVVLVFFGVPAFLSLEVDFVLFYVRLENIVGAHAEGLR